MNDTTNIDSLLDSSLDDLADLPEFKVFNPGAHRVTIKFEKKQIGEHPAIELKMTLIETVELSNASATVDEPGTESSVAFMLDNEFGQGKLKEVLKPLSQHLGTVKTSEIIEQSSGLECLVVTVQRQNKEKTQTYCDIKSIQVV